MSTDDAIHESIETAAQTVGSRWPLHSFVTANPLSGFEDQPFHEAVAAAADTLGSDGYPDADVFRRAWEDGRIDPDVLRDTLREHGYESEPEATLDRMATAERAEATETATATDRVDAVLTKWLSAFLDQGQAKWPMPEREDGFYDAFRAVARHDGEIPDAEAIAELPDRPLDAIREQLVNDPVGEWPEIFEFHLAALPGWTGLLKQRTDDGDAWQSAYPITLAGYLAVRLTLVDLFDAPRTPEEADGDDATADGAVPLPEVWLTAWEATYRSALVAELTDASESVAATGEGDRPDAQLVFCIDTRSEIIRRHVEAAGDYETHGYAGFFGVPMRYEGHDAAVAVDACPPILDPQHRIADRPTDGEGSRHAEHDRWTAMREATESVIGRLRSNAATAFSYVESTGAGYGAALAARTLVPGRVHDLVDAVDDRTPDDHAVWEPAVDHDPDHAHELPAGLTVEEKTEYAATAFELMGWEQFARLVVFTGHASQTANNPFDASLDCGACAGNPGGPSARVLAALCNDEAVRERLRDRGIDVPEDTYFLAGEHNTTTDEIELYADAVPETHAEDVRQLRADLETARAGAAAERADDMGADGDAGRETHRRAADWAETRPEWGLAGNAGFVVGPRELTDGLDLDARAFLHSYDWTTDDEGDALEGILTGPMVVTQWINAQYYFSTVDNAVFGSGSKVTHNPVGNVGVYQGNGGDLLTGLPLQSLMAADDEPYHQPLRLSTVVHAPVERVTDVLADNPSVTELLDNDWLHLTVVDPEQEHRAFHYTEDLEWTPVDEQAPTAPEQTATVTPSTADD
ncbi:DUF2309 domain-containing protein [Halomicrobium sp. LC1Hm]|uniref:DUF2309 domain-containing protein n=1 Tax=Halomicrobium sp. LC1Hm TaxID=2610902 RepID=UPI0012985345|nr:DUF2309 domain-containing protein [Halomicrobium sp. LC1Hm]QGA81121.1 hypothetical protein LC1Hm_0051 [Halomicrobium sp. LC1Hm]